MVLFAIIGSLCLQVLVLKLHSFSFLFSVAIVTNFFFPFFLSSKFAFKLTAIIICNIYTFVILPITIESNGKNQINVFDAILAVLFCFFSVMIHALTESAILFICEYFYILNTKYETYATLLQLNSKTGILVLEKNTLAPQYLNMMGRFILQKSDPNTDQQLDLSNKEVDMRMKNNEIN